MNYTILNSGKSSKIYVNKKERQVILSRRWSMNYKKYICEKEIPGGIVDVKKKSLKRNFELHWHDFFEMTYYYEGNGYTVINGEKYEIKPGTAVILAPTDCHEIVVETPMIEITAMIHPDTVLNEIKTGLISGEAASVCIFHDDERKRIETLFDMLYSEFRLRRHHDVLNQKHLINILLVLISRRCDTQRGRVSANKLTYKKSERNFKRAVTYILMNFTRNPSLTEVAEHVGYSTSYFSRQFHQLYGMTYKEYLRKLKLGYAKKLLMAGDMSVDEISNNSGYETLQSFLADFKKTYGETPSSFKKRLIESEIESQPDEDLAETIFEY